MNATKIKEPSCLSTERMIFMTKRTIPLAVVFTVFTGGIYGLYWLYALTEDAYTMTGQRTTASGGKVVLFTILTCSIYGFYWFYKMGENIISAQQVRNMMVDNNLPFIYLALALFCSWPVSLALIQSSLNVCIDHDGGASQAF